MPETVFLPKWGMTMTEAIIAHWFVAEGDKVSEGQDLVEVETDKAVNTLPAPVSGKLTAILVPAGETVEVGTELAIISPD